MMRFYLTLLFLAAVSVYGQDSRGECECRHGARHGIVASYQKTDFDVFYRGRKIKGASASTFLELADGYAKDTFNMYYWGRKIEK